MTDKVRPVAPNSFKGSASVDVLMGSIARQMQPPRTFENNGVDVTLDNVYLPGTLDEQVRNFAEGMADMARLADEDSRQVSVQTSLSGAGTVEDVADDVTLHPVQRAMVDHAGSQTSSTRIFMACGTTRSSSASTPRGGSGSRPCRATRSGSPATPSRATSS